MKTCNSCSFLMTDTSWKCLARFYFWGCCFISFNIPWCSRYLSIWKDMVNWFKLLWAFNTAPPGKMRGLPILCHRMQEQRCLSSYFPRCPQAPAAGYWWWMSGPCRDFGLLGILHWPQRDKKSSLLSSAVAAAGQQRLACGSRAGGSIDPSGDASAKSCACALLSWGEDTSLCSSCCETTRAVWLQKLPYKLWKLAPNSCSQMGIWNKASYIYYLDQRDLLFFKGACKCFVASSSYSLPVKFFLQHLFLDLDQKYLRILRVGPGFSTCAAFEKTFSLTAVKDLISVQQLWFFLLQMGTASHHHYNRFGKGIDWKSELQNNANGF